MKPIYKTEIRVTDVENKFMVMGRGGDNLGDWDWHTMFTLLHIGTVFTLLHVRQITNKSLLYSTGNSSQYSVMTYMGKEF